MSKCGNSSELDLFFALNRHTLIRQKFLLFRNLFAETNYSQAQSQV